MAGENEEALAKYHDRLKKVEENVKNCLNAISRIINDYKAIQSSNTEIQKASTEVNKAVASFSKDIEKLKEDLPSMVISGENSSGAGINKEELDGYLVDFLAEKLPDYISVAISNQNKRELLLSEKENNSPKNGKDLKYKFFKFFAIAFLIVAIVGFSWKQYTIDKSYVVIVPEQTKIFASENGKTNFYRASAGKFDDAKLKIINNKKYFELKIENKFYYVKFEDVKVGE